MEAFRESLPDEAGLYDRPWINHLAWTLVVLLTGLVFWMAIAIVNAENQRNALANKQCRDRVLFRSRARSKSRCDRACHRCRRR